MDNKSHNEGKVSQLKNPLKSRSNGSGDGEKFVEFRHNRKPTNYEGSPGSFSRPVKQLVHRLITLLTLWQRIHKQNIEDEDIV